MNARVLVAGGGLCLALSFGCWAAALAHGGGGSGARLLASCAPGAERVTVRAVAVRTEPLGRVDAPIAAPGGTVAHTVYTLAPGAKTLQLEGRAVPLDLGREVEPRLRYAPFQDGIVQGPPGPPVYPVDGIARPDGDVTVVRVPDDGPVRTETVPGRPEGARLADGRRLRAAQAGPRVDAPLFDEGTGPVTVTVRSPRAVVHLDVLTDEGACLVQDRPPGTVALDVGSCAGTWVWVHASHSPYSAGGGEGRLIVRVPPGLDAPARAARLVAAVPADARDDALVARVRKDPAAASALMLRAMRARLSAVPARAPSCSPAFVDQAAQVDEVRGDRMAPYRLGFRALAAAGLGLILFGAFGRRGRRGGARGEALDDDEAEGLAPDARARWTGIGLLVLAGLVLWVLDWTLTPLFST